ncbi:MAG: LysM peptidoglycan-binding domain-containing protein [Gammaproteobacteria bacterium]|nr:LysM peptidoglycan-binding domain-containing protein [Gammaproteobacteria bacterium]
MYRSLWITVIFIISGCASLTANKSTSDLSPSGQRTNQDILLQQCHAESEQIDTQAYTNVWKRIEAQLSFDIPENKRTTSQKNWYLKHPEYMKRVTERASPYLFYIAEELEKNNLPMELALLPIVESAYDPFAYSHGRASGMWQFIPGTAKMFGVKSNWWYDGRRDIVASTQAAIGFLSHLNKRFNGNWMYALAAYNSGEGNVRKAIRKNKRKGKPLDFWSLDLPKETEAYVPKLLALASILKENIDDQTMWVPVDNLPFFDTVSTETQIDLSLAASLAEMSMDEFYQINPGYNHWATSPTGNHMIALPIDKIDIFKQNLQKIPADQRISYKRYTIKSGDSLISIAKKFDTTVTLLRSHNSIRGNTIRQGKTLLIPVASQARDQYHKSQQQRLMATQNTRRNGHKQVIYVQAGDSMWEIAKRYKVNVRSLAKWNNMAPTDPLQVGKKLVIWTKKPELVSLSNNNKKTRKIYYTVRQGDSLAKIASKFKVSLASLKRWNNSVGNKKYLKPGDSLKLYIDITEQF